MVKLCAVLHPRAPEVGDPVTVVPVEVATAEDAARLDGLTLPAGFHF